MSEEVQNIRIKYIVDDSQLKKPHDDFKKIEASAKQATQSIENTGPAISKSGSLIGKLTDSLKDTVGHFNIMGVSGASAFASLAGGIGTTTTSLKAFRVALVSTGIGALVVALGSLIAYFTKTDAGSEKLQASFKAIGAVVTVIFGKIVALGEAVFNTLKKAFQDPLQAIKDLGNAIQENIINRFKAIGIFGEAIVKLFKGDLTGATKAFADATIQLNTGITNGTDKLKKLGDEMEETARIAAEAAKEAYALSLAFEELEDRERDFKKTSAEAENQIAKLIVQAKNRTLADQERINLLNQASAIEKKNYEESLSIAQTRVDFIKKENAFLERQGQLQDDDRDKQIEAEVNLLRIQGDSLVLQEKINNRKDALIDQIIQDTLTKEKQKNIDLENIEKQRFVDGITDKETYEENLFNIEVRGLESLRELYKKYGKDFADIDKQILDLKIKRKEDGLSKEAKAEENRLKDQKEQFELAQKEITEALAEQEKLRTQIAAEQAANRKAINQKSADIAIAIGNGLFDLETANREQALADLQTKKDSELALVGENKQAQAIINKKFADQERDLKRKQAVSDKEQALFNIFAQTAINTVKAYGTPPVPNIPLALITAALGGVQGAFVAAKPIPKFNRGTKRVPGIDAGSDSVLSLLRPGEGVMPVDRMGDYQPAFDAIFDRKVPAGLLNNFVMDYSRLGKTVPMVSDNSLHKELQKINKTLANLKTAEITIDKKGIATFIKSGAGETEVMNNYFRLK